MVSSREFGGKHVLSCDITLFGRSLNPSDPLFDIPQISGIPKQ